MNLIISVIDSLMSAGSVYGRKKREQTALHQNMQLRKITLLSIYTKTSTFPSFRTSMKENTFLI